MIGIRLTTPALATPSHMAATTPSPTPAQSETFVKELVRSLNIQLDNLCQFLPQERVADFAKLNAQELLVETQRAVGKGACKEGGGMCVALGLLSCVVLGDTGGGVASPCRVVVAIVASPRVSPSYPPPSPTSGQRI